MNKNYNELIARLNQRSNPDNIILEKSFTEELGRIPQRGVFLYIKKAMRGVEPEYTQKSLEAGKKVKEKLQAELENVSFEFQGSVMTNTHIKGYSDIDLLTICEKFFTFDRNGISETLNSPVKTLFLSESQKQTLQRVLQGGGYSNSMSDLRKLRLDSEEILNKHYSYVDSSKPKSIKTSLTYPKRDVDVVIANWFKDSSYYIKNDKSLLGIKIFVKGDTAAEDKELKPDFPFLSISRINQKDAEVYGRLKKMIRFLKNVKGDSGASDSIKLTSFDFNAICYDIDKSVYHNHSYLDLVLVVYNQLNDLAKNPVNRYNLKSVDGHEFIFINEDGTENTSKVNSLKMIMNEVNLILKDIAKENQGIRVIL